MNIHYIFSSDLSIDNKFLVEIEEVIDEIDDNLIVRPTMKKIDELLAEVNFQIKEVA